MTAHPSLSIFEIRSNGLNNVNCLGTFELKPLGAKAPSFEALQLKKSFCDLNCVISGIDSSSVYVLLDGRQVPSTALAKDTSAFITIPLDRDLEYHELSIVADHKFAASIIIHCVHHYDFTFAERGVISTPKWSFETLADELDQWKVLFSRFRQTSIGPDPIRRALGCAETPVEDWQAVVFKTATRLATLLTATPIQSLLPDYALDEPIDMSIDRVLQVAKENPKSLSEHPCGPITIGAHHYSMPNLEFEDTPGSRVTLSEIKASLEFAILGLRRGGCAGASMEILYFAKNQLPQEQRLTGMSVSDVLLRFLTRRMKTFIGYQLQQVCRQLMILSLLGRGRAGPLDAAIEGLIAGIRDFDVFQTTTFAVFGLALGYSREQVLQSNGLLTSGKHSVIDLNAFGNRRYMETHLKGWRDGSAQPSNYLPDLLVLYENKIPLLIDAKFRIPETSSQLANADGIKDIQAYMDEYNQKGAIIASPLVPKLLGDRNAHEIPMIKGGRDEGSQRAIAILEIPSSRNPDVIPNALKAVNAIIDL